MRHDLEIVWTSKPARLLADLRCRTWAGISIGGTALSIAATGATIAANAKEQAAMNAARANEVSQQAALQQKNQAIANQSIQKSTPKVAQQQLQQGQDQRTALFTALQKASVPIASALPATNNARSSAGGNAWQSIVAGNQAKAGSYADWESQQANKNAQAGQEIGIGNNFSQGTASLLPIQMQVAGQAGDELSGWGSIVGAIGRGAMTTGAVGMGSQSGAGNGSFNYNPATSAGNTPDWSNMNP